MNNDFDDAEAQIYIIIIAVMIIDDFYDAEAKRNNITIAVTLLANPEQHLS